MGRQHVSLTLDGDLVTSIAPKPETSPETTGETADGRDTDAPQDGEQPPRQCH